MNTIPLRIDRQKTACVAVDPQRGFTPLCPTELQVPDGDGIVAAIRTLMDCASVRVVSMDCHPSVAPWVAASPEEILRPITGYPHLDVKWPAHCVEGTEGNRLIAGLDEADFDWVVRKGMNPEKHPYGACYHGLDTSESTGLIERLRAEEVATVLVGGLATEFCVATTARQLRTAGFEVVVALPACRGLSPKAIGKAVDTMEDEGIVVLREMALLKAD